MRPTLDFYSEASKALSRVHGERIMSVLVDERIREAFGQAEEAYLELQKTRLVRVAVVPYEIEEEDE